MVAASPDPGRYQLIVSLWVEARHGAEFEQFEAQAASIMQRYGGRIDHVLRRQPPMTEDDPFEVHWVSFPDQAAFEEYRQDAELLALSPVRQRVISRTMVFTGELRKGYGESPVSPRR